jgi:predicted phosphodiesterase
MKTLIFSDVHGNLPAFESLLQRESDAEAFICLGDLVNYAPWSNACVELALTLPNCVYIMGNHEEAFLQGSYPAENPLVQAFFNQTIADFRHHDPLSKFQDSYENFGYCFTHTLLNQYIYPDTTIELDKNCVIGHSHHQFLYQNKGFKLYNAGSVGQNRQFINVANYLIFDNKTGQFELKAFRYDIDIVIQEMRAQHYPIACIDYYAQKKQA